MKFLYAGALTALLLLHGAYGFSPPASKTQSLSYGMHKKISKPYESSIKVLYSSLSDDKQKDETEQIKTDVVADLFSAQPKSHILGEPIPYEKLTIGVVKEDFPGENRVALTPDSVELLVKAGFHVAVQAGGKFLQVDYEIICKASIFFDD